MSKNPSIRIRLWTKSRNISDNFTADFRKGKHYEKEGELLMEGTGVKVLVADDNSKNVYMLEVLLKSAGYEVVSAKNGIDALEKLHDGHFDGIVSDILMPLMDGFRLIRECKRDPALRQIPFIFYTATYTEKKDEAFGLSLGAIRYIIKPAEPEELLRLIREAFIEDAKSQNDTPVQPVLDEDTFSREYSLRVGEKLEKKAQLLTESEEKYRLLYDNSMDAILLTSPDGSIQAANPAACVIFQRSEEEIIKNGRSALIDSTDPRLTSALEERARTNRFVGELTFIRKDGTRFAGEVSSNLFTDRNGNTRSSMIIRDISERRKQEQALQIANQKLNLMNIVAWHDINNKITGLRGYVELSKNYITDPQAQEFLTREEEILGVIQQQIKYTEEYQEIGRLSARWHNLGSLVENVRITGKAELIRITNKAENLELYADPVIEKVFWHLVDDSAKHGEKVTEIWITVRESESGCILVYEDNGVGIPENKRKNLFTKSFGTMNGFNLFFVHDILEISGMKIEETGTAGAGVRFEITVPKGLYRFAKKGSVKGPDLVNG
jgi:PAS domain S-box-containing protein